MRSGCDLACLLEELVRGEGRSVLLPIYRGGRGVFVNVNCLVN
jgi:hypothetical protein